MIIVKTHGGLGNQFFQYAAAKALAKFHGVEFKIEISSVERYLPSEFCLDKFSISSPVATKEEIDKYSSFEKKDTQLKNFFLEKFNFLLPYVDFLNSYKKKKIYHERFFQYNRHFFDLPPTVYLVGYFQSQKYFESIKNNIAKDFELKDQTGKAFNMFAKKIKESRAVSIHFRRGDYITHPGINSIFGVPDNQYYYNAVKKISEKIDSPTFFIFSNDVQWVRDNFLIPFPVVYVTDQDLKFYEEMTLMSLCEHNIIANSSFSWWGAWLNSNENKIIIAPKKWFSWWKLNTKDILPETWIKI